MSDDPNRDLRDAINRLTTTIDGLRTEWAEIYARKDVIEPQLTAIKRDVDKHAGYWDWLIKLVAAALILSLLGTVLVQSGGVQL